MFTFSDLRKAYLILGLEEGTSVDVCKKEYRRLSLIHHPDRGGDAEKFSQLTDAFETIKQAHQVGMLNGVSKAMRVCKHKDLMHFYVKS